MERYYLQTIGTPIMAEHRQGMLTRVRDVVINPVNGKIVAFWVTMSGYKVIAPIDVIHWGDTIEVDDPHDIVEAAEIQSVRAVMEKHVTIQHKKVVTQNGEELGRVIDFALDTKFFRLSKLVVAKSFLKLIFWEQKIIPLQDIIEIKPKAIIVKNKMKPIKMKKFKMGMASAPQAETS